MDRVNLIMSNSRQHYQELPEFDHDDEPSVLVHTAEAPRTRWNLIRDLDSFLKMVYEYHQRHGFTCIVAKEICETIRRIFMSIFPLFLLYGIDYPALFSYKVSDSNVSFSDLILPFDKMIQNFGLWTWMWIMMLIIVFIFFSIRSVLKVRYFYEIKQFYNTALKIEEADLDNYVWQDVQKKIIAAQSEFSMCVHKRELTELDIHHRILRQQNYFIAMVNKHLIPPRLNIPFLGDVLYWSIGFQLNLRFILFHFPWGAFKDSWHLRDEYRKATLKTDLANQLKLSIRLFAIGNLILCIPIFLWQFVYSYCYNSDFIVRKVPWEFATRNWSLYGKQYLRHFNELDHELDIRLNKAHKPASRYLELFFSPLNAIIAQTIQILVASTLMAFYVLTLIHEDILAIGNAVLIFTIASVIIIVCKSQMPKEHVPNSPDILLANVLVHTHYLHQEWQSKAHTAKVRTEFERLFQLRIQGIIEDLISPFMTPFLLFFYVAPKSKDIVDFFYNFTVSVTGVGDVCSFAVMDIRKHGNPDWHHKNVHDREVPTQFAQAEDGKVELSLLHFKHTNPNWQPPTEAQSFFHSIQDHENEIDDLMSVDSSLHQYTPRMQFSQNHQFMRENPIQTSEKEVSRGALYLHLLRSQHEQGRSIRIPPQENTPLLFNH
ncbi:autophagy-related protein 9A isoform X1 [Harmonia axyridis]|uniref:autophagy-related protein 9A isoform X1 n=1 Tax=Harmonia axyridis TaxID=115357 RepID=UPI001E278DE0|nr:autophagy-related protein 9A isoform X1 [Harmonia axyridis]